MADSVTTLSILLIEDEPADSKLLQAILRDEIQRGEVIIQTVRKLKVACEELRRFSFSCVLMDLGLPDGVGVDGVLKLREADPNTTIIVLTGFDDERSAHRAMELGAQEYLVKGRYDGPELLRILRHAVLRDHHAARKDATAPGMAHDGPQGALAGLATQAQFEDRAQQMLSTAKLTHAQLALCSIEVVAGGAAPTDATLNGVAQALSQRTRETDALAHAGGGEFLALFNCMGTRADPRLMAERIRSELQALVVDGIQTAQRTSIGIAMYPQHGDTLAILMHNARIVRQQMQSVGGGVLRVGEPVPERSAG